jgi:hypothetical protein
VLFCQICDYHEDRGGYPSEISWELEKYSDTYAKAIHALEDTHCTENETSKNEQVASEGIIFPYIRGVFMIEWVPERQTDNQIRCLELLTNLLE